jgi:WD40 repeat protein
MAPICMPGPRRFVAFSPHSKTLASGGSDKTIKMRDIVSGKITAKSITLSSHEFQNLVAS